MTIKPYLQLIRLPNLFTAAADPLAGWLVDRLGPRPVAIAGAVLIFVAWTLNAHASSLAALYLAAVLGGIGVGCVYGTCVGNALKWFPDKRGFAAGLTATGFGVGAALTVVPIANSIQANGYRQTFSTFALILGGAVLVLSMFLKAPPATQKASRRAGANLEGTRDYTPLEVIKTGPFWVMYVIFTAVSVGGLMTTAQIGPIANAFGIAGLPAFVGATMPLLTLTLSIDNLVNGLTRPLGGFISDRIGRENTMCVIFIGEGLALLGLVTIGHHPLGFLICAPAIFLFWGETYALSSALAGDTFGTKNVTANAAALYTTKGLAALIVPFGSYLAVTTGSWTLPVSICAAIAIAVGLMSKLVLSPMRRRFIARSNGQEEANASQELNTGSLLDPIFVAGPAA